MRGRVTENVQDTSVGSKAEQAVLAQLTPLLLLPLLCSSMANQVVRLWQGVLDELEEMASVRIGCRDSTIEVLLEAISQLPQQPQAILKRLLQDMQARC